MTRHGADLVKDDFERSFVGIREPLKNTGVEKMIKRNTRETSHPQRCETCENKEPIPTPRWASDVPLRLGDRCKITGIECNNSFTSLVGCASHNDAKSERKKLLEELIKHYEKIIADGKGVTFNHPVTYRWMYGNTVVEYLKHLYRLEES